MNTDDQIKLAQAQLIQHTAEQMGIDVNTLSTEDLAKFASHVLAEAGTSQAEQELETKVAEADALGRLMARSFVEEQAKVAQEEMAARGMPSYTRNALQGMAVGGLAGLAGGAGYGLLEQGANPTGALAGAAYGGIGAAAGGAAGALAGLGSTALQRALQRRAITAQQAAAAPVEEKVASAMGDIQNFWAMKIAEEMEEESAAEESAAEEAAMENESAEQEAEEEAAAEDEAKEAMLHLAQALHANGRTKTAGALLTKLAQEEAAAQEMPGYGRAALRGAALGALGGGLANAGLGAALGHYAPAGFPGDVLGISGQGALQGALRGGGAGAAIGAGLGTMGSLARTALQRRAIAKQQEAAKQAAYEFAKLAEARAAEIMAANGIHPATLEPIAPSNVKIAHVVTPDAVHSYAEKVAAAQFNEQLDSAALHILKSIGFV